MIDRYRYFTYSDSVEPTDEQIRTTMRAAMTEQGLTQQQMAERLGIKQASFSEVLSGKYGRVPPSLLRALDALGLELVARPKGGAH